MNEEDPKKKIAKVKTEIDFEQAPEFSETREETIARLAELSAFDYDGLRKGEAKRLGVQLKTLDREVEKLRRRAFVAADAEARTASSKFKDLLDNHALIISPHAIIEMKTDKTISFQAFKQSLAPQFSERIPSVLGADFVIHNFDFWLEDPRRKRYEKKDFVPGGAYPDVNISGVGLVRNTWNGFAVKPEEGDYETWLAMHERLFVNKPGWMRTYSLDWYSHLVQRPGDKCNVAQVITGPSGIGKDLVVGYLGKALGRHFKEVDGGDLRSSFSEYLEDTLLLNAQEVSSPDRRADADIYKGLITKETVLIDIKYGGKYRQTNRVRQVLTSNHPDPVFATDDERRFYCVSSQAPPMEREETARVLHSRDQENGPAHLLHFLLNRKISDAFNATAPAPRTSDFYQIVEADRSELEIFAQGVVADPYGLRKPGFANGIGVVDETVAPMRDVYDLKDLLSFFNSSHVHSPQALAKALLKTRKIARPGDGLKSARKKGEEREYRVRLKDQRLSPPLWAIENIEYWRTAPTSAWAHEYERGMIYSKVPAKKLYPPAKWLTQQKVDGEARGVGVPRMPDVPDINDARERRRKKSVGGK